MNLEESRLQVARYNKKINEAIGKIMAIQGELAPFRDIFRELPVIEARVSAHIRFLSVAISNMDNMRPMLFMLDEDVKERVEATNKKPASKEAGAPEAKASKRPLMKR